MSKSLTGHCASCRITLTRSPRLCMNLNAAHSNGCPLDFKGLLEANLSDFSHDIYGFAITSTATPASVRTASRPATHSVTTSSVLLSGPGKFRDSRLQ